jgi:PAS domain S-box-containing protein
MSLLLFVHFTAFAVYLWLISLVLSRNPQGRPNRLLGLLLGGFAIWSLATGFLQGSTTSEEAHLWLNIASLGWCSFPVLALWAYLAITDYHRLLDNKAFLVGTALLAIFFIVEQRSGNILSGVSEQTYGWSTVWSGSWVSYLYLAYFAAFIMSCVALIFIKMRGAATRRERRQALVLFAAPIVAVPIGAATDVVAPLTGIMLVPPLGSIAALVWGAALTLAITRYGLVTPSLKTLESRIFDTATEALFILSPEGRILAANQSARNWLGYTTEELAGKPLSELISSTEDTDNLLVRLSVGQPVEGLRTSLETKDGRFTPTLLSLSVAKDRWGDTFAILASALDISNLEEAANKLRASEVRYRALFETSTDLLARVDQEGRFLTVNRAMADSFGLSPEEIEGKSFFDVMPPEVARRRLEAGLEAVKEKKAVFLEDEREGRFFRQWFVPLELPEGAIFQIIAVDITQYKKMEESLRHSEENYRLLVEHALVGIGIHQKGHFVYANHQLAALFGYPIEEFVGMSIGDIIHPRDREMVLRRAENRQKGLAEPEHYEFTGLKKDGSSFYAVVSNALVEHEGQAATLITIMDITDTRARKELEGSKLELEAALSKLEQIDSDRKKMLAEISHDLRTPLAAVMGFAELLANNGNLPAPAREQAKIINQESAHLNRLVDDILDLSQAEEGRLRYDIVPCAISEPITQAIKLLQGEASRKGLYIKVELPDDLPDVLADADRIRQVMVNLISNAINATDKGGITIKVSYDRDKLTVAVSDTGVGIRQEDMAKLFTPFSRIGGNYKGAGIGLSISRLIIEHHGGYIDAMSRYGSGSTFYFTLPLAGRIAPRHSAD